MAAITFVSEEKWRRFNCFSIRVVRGSPTGSNSGNAEGDRDIGSPVLSVFLWVTSARGAGALSSKNKTTLVNLAQDFSLNCTSREE